MNVFNYYSRIFKNNPIAFQSILTFILRIFGVIILFGFTLFLTKNFSPKIVGQYEFVRSFLLVTGSLCLLGFDQSILYFSGLLNGLDSLSEIKNVYKKMVRIVFIIATLFFIIVLCLNKKFVNQFFTDPEAYKILLKSTGVLFFYSLSVLNTEGFRAMEKIYIAELFRNTLKHIPIIIGAIILSIYHNKNYLIDVFFTGFIILALFTTILIYYFFNEIGTEKGKTIFSYKEIIIKSYPISISGMALFLLLSLDIFFLKKYKNDQTVAYYSLAVKLMTILSMIIVTVNITVSSKIAEYFSTNNKLELINILKKSSRLIILITIPVTTFVCLFSEKILIFFGREYVVAKDALFILMIGQVVCSAFGSASIYLNMTGRQHIFQFILMFAVGINFVLNRYLIPDYGMTGAAVAFVVSSFIWNLISAIIIYRKDKVIVFLN